MSSSSPSSCSLPKLPLEPDFPLLSLLLSSLPRKFSPHRSTPNASEFHFSSSSQHSRNASSSTYRPPRPSRSPPPPSQRRVVSNPPPLPTTLPTRTRVVPLIPGLGFHLAQRRAAEATSNPLPSLSGGVNNTFELSSPSSNYSHPEDSSSSDSDECPPTESDRPDSVAPAPEVTEPWQESDNYQSPVWASRWSRRGSEASGTGTAGGRGTEAGIDPLDRRPSFSAFAAARRRDSFDSGWGAGPSRDRDSSVNMSRRPSSSSSLRFDTTSLYVGAGAGRGQPTARRHSNASNAPYPNFPFPFPGGGPRGSKASLYDSMNGVGGGTPSHNILRRDSNVSIRYSDDEDGDAWDDLHDPDSAVLSRRSSYDSSFAFDRGRAASFSYSPTNNSFLESKRKTSQDSYTFGSLAPSTSRATGFRRNSSQGSLRDLPRPPTSFGLGSRNSSITGGAGGLVVSRKGSWQSQMGLMISGGRMERNMSVDSVGEVERIRRLGGMRELNRRESEVLEMGWRMLEMENQYAYEENQWGPSMEPGIVSLSLSLLSPFHFPLAVESVIADVSLPSLSSSDPVSLVFLNRRVSLVRRPRPARRRVFAGTPRLFVLSFVTYLARLHSGSSISLPHTRRNLRATALDVHLPSRNPLPSPSFLNGSSRSTTNGPPTSNLPHLLLRSLRQELPSPLLRLARPLRSQSRAVVSSHSGPQAFQEDLVFAREVACSDAC